MKPFQLQTVLKYRQRLEDIAKNRLYEAQRQQEIVQQRLDKDNKNLVELIKTIEQLQKKPVSILDLINYENRILYEKKNILAVKKKLQEKTDNTKKERQNLIEKAKDRQIMESLKSRQDQLWKDYLNKKEAAMLDEIAIVRHDMGQF